MMQVTRLPLHYRLLAAVLVMADCPVLVGLGAGGSISVDGWNHLHLVLDSPC
jgi:hypothetical protein